MEHVFVWFEIYQTIKLFANKEMCLGLYTKVEKVVWFSLTPYFHIELLYKSYEL